LDEKRDQEQAIDSLLSSQYLFSNICWFICCYTKESSQVSLWKLLKDTVDWTSNSRRNKTTLYCPEVFNLMTPGGNEIGWDISLNTRIERVLKVATALYS